jgi:hypothetical protein
MAWDDEADIGVQSRDVDANDGIQLGDDEGPGIGHGAWVGGVWHDQIDPHHFATRESQSRLEFDLDYIPNPVQVMTMCN